MVIKEDLGDSISLRQAQHSDEEFLFDLFASSRPDLTNPSFDEVIGKHLLSMQFQARSLEYEKTYPSAENLIIQHEDRQVGRLLTDSAESIITLVDICLLPSMRRRGIGTQLVRALQRTGKHQSAKILLTVAKDNLAAIRCYEKLNFAAVSSDHFYWFMEWS